MSKLKNINKNIYLFFAINLLASFAMGIFNMFVGIYLKEVGYEENIVGMILSLNVFAMAIASIPSAYLIEKIGRKRSFRLGFISIAIGSVFLVLFKNVFLIGIMAIINGFGMSVKNTAEGMYITENTKEEERISIFSINFIVSNIGMMSASFIGGILSTYMSKYFTSQQSITYIFIISAILSILAFIPIYFMKEPKNLQSRNFKQCLQGYNHVISDRKVLFFMMYYLVIGIGAGMVVPFFSVYLKYSMTISDSIVGSILSISQFGCILGGSLIPFMSNKFGKSNSVIICQLISIPFLLSIAFPQGIILIAISFFMRNGLMNMATPLTQNLSMELVDKKDRTNLSSMISLCSNISRAIGISIGGVIMEKISYNSPYYLTVILYIIGVVIFASLYKNESKLVRQKKYKEEHAFRH